MAHAISILSTLVTEEHRDWCFYDPDLMRHSCHSWRFTHLLLCPILGHFFLLSKVSSRWSWEYVQHCLFGNWHASGQSRFTFFPSLKMVWLHALVHCIPDLLSFPAILSSYAKFMNCSSRQLDKWDCREFCHWCLWPARSHWFFTGFLANYTWSSDWRLNFISNKMRFVNDCLICKILLQYVSSA